MPPPRHGSHALVRLSAGLLPRDERDELAGDLFEQYLLEGRTRLWLLRQGLALAWGLHVGRCHIHCTGQRSWW